MGGLGSWAGINKNPLSGEHSSPCPFLEGPLPSLIDSQITTPFSGKTMRVEKNYTFHTPPPPTGRKEKLEHQIQVPCYFSLWLEILTT